MGAIGTFVNSVVGIGNITVTTTAGVATVDGSALATTTLNNLGTTAVNKTLNMAGTTGNADLLWTGNNGMIGVGFSQTSGTDRRPGKAFLKDALLVGNTFGNNPPYGGNNPLFTGMALLGNQTNVSMAVGANTLMNSVAMGFIGFAKDGAATNVPAFINLDTAGDHNVYFSLLHLSSARTDYLKFGTGTITFLQASGANLLWNTDGGGNIGASGATRPNNLFLKAAAAIGTSVSVGTTLTMSAASSANMLWSTDGAGNVGADGANRPNNIYAANYLQVGTDTNFGGPFSGYVQAGAGANNFAFIGSENDDIEIGMADASGDSVWFSRTPSTTPAGQMELKATGGGQTNHNASGGAIFGINGLTGYSLPTELPGTALFFGQSDAADLSGTSMGISCMTNGVYFGEYGSVPTAIIRPNGLVAAETLGVGNAASATIAVGTLAKKIEIFDKAGVSLGFIPVYASIT
jgi:hypothetical protein